MDKKHRIITATEQLALKKNYNELTLEEIAQLANVGKGTVYLYFRNKEDLFFQTALFGFDEMCDILMEKMEKSSKEISFRDNLLEICSRVRKFFTERKPLVKIIFSEGERASGKPGPLKQRWNSKRRKMIEIMVSTIERGIKSGEVRTQIEPEILVEYLIGMLRTKSEKLGNSRSDSTSLENLVDLFIFGVSNNNNDIDISYTDTNININKNKNKKSIGNSK